MEFRPEYKHWSCPACEQNTVVRVVMGMPMGDLFDASARGDVILGGCIIDDNTPRRPVQCTNCGWSGEQYGRGVRLFHRD